MSRVDRNFAAIEQALNKVNVDNGELQTRMATMERTISVLQSELANQKQLTAHVLGRGMGSTVQE